MYRCFLPILLLVVLASATKQSYDGNIVLSVIPSRDEHFQLLETLEEHNEISIWNELHRNGSVHVMLNQNRSAWLTSVFRSLDMQPSMRIADVQKLLDDEDRHLRAKTRSGAPRSILDTFYTYDELSAWLKQMAAAYPNLATLSSIGKTYENRDIWLIKLTANSGFPKKTAFLDFGIHAREWISTATGAFIINELLTTYPSNITAKTLLDTYEFHIVPILNPDGYAYTHSTNRMWRKNRRPAGGTAYGVDLNRNFGYQWNTGGSSGIPSSDTFHGGSPMSENEVKALERYMTGKSWTTYLSCHSYGGWWFTNWAYTTAYPPDYNLSLKAAQVGADAIQRVYGRKYVVGPSAQLLYIGSGGSRDWTRGTLNIFYSYGLELPEANGSGFIAPTSEIKKTGYETYVGFAAFLNAL